MSFSSRPISILVYGATGFTGKEVTRYLTNLQSCSRWAIAGRSQEKLNILRSDLSVPNHVDCFAVDCKDTDGLTNLFKNCELVLNCTGPFRFLGEPVVSACIEAGCHYMDITGEPQFMENIFVKYHEKAKNAHVLVIHAAAFDSVPADLG